MGEVTHADVHSPSLVFFGGVFAIVVFVFRVFYRYPKLTHTHVVLRQDMASATIYQSKS